MIDNNQVVYVGVHARRGDRLQVFHWETFETFWLRNFWNILIEKLLKHFDLETFDDKTTNIEAWKSEHAPLKDSMIGHYEGRFLLRGRGGLLNIPAHTHLDCLFSITVCQGFSTQRWINYGTSSTRKVRGSSSLPPATTSTGWRSTWWTNRHRSISLNIFFHHWIYLCQLKEDVWSTLAHLLRTKSRTFSSPTS